MMSTPQKFFRVLILVLLGVMFMTSSALAQNRLPPAGFTEDRTESLDSTSFITSPSPTCTKPNPKGTSCTIKWSYLYVNTDTGYMKYLRIKINDKIVAYHQGFFQSEFYIDGTMYGNGFTVVCGQLGAGGDPELGSFYTYQINASNTLDQTSSNSGSVFCPAGTKQNVFLPLIGRH